MDRYKSLFDVAKDIKRRQEQGSTDEATVNQLDELAEQAAHADFIHPSQINLETNAGHEFEQQAREDILDKPDRCVEPQAIITDTPDFNGSTAEGNKSQPVEDSELSDDEFDFNDLNSVEDLEFDNSDDSFDGILQSNSPSVNGSWPDLSDAELDFNDLNSVENLEFDNSDDSFDGTPQSSSPSVNIGWVELSEAEFDFDEISPSAETNLDELLPENSNLDDYALNLAYHYGHHPKSARKIFRSILEQFPSHNSYRAIWRLIDKGFSLEIIVDAVEIRSNWQSSPDLWLIRDMRAKRWGYSAIKFSRQGYYQLTWEICAKLCSIYGGDEAFNKILNYWKEEWVGLDVSTSFSDVNTRNNYFYFVSFIAFQANFKTSEFPVSCVDHFGNDEEYSWFVHKEKFKILCADPGF